MNNSTCVAPVVIQVLLAVHCQPTSAWPFDITAPSYMSALRKLINDGIACCLGADTYCLTDKGIAWLEAILSTPYPVARWTDPRFGEVK